jgi:hypothetical protein
VALPIPPDAMVIFFRVGFRERDEVPGCLGLHCRIDEKKHRSGADQTDRCEVADGIVVHALLDRRNDGMRHVGEQQGVAVRRGFGSDLDTETTASTRTVVDDDLLAERFRQPLTEKAGEHIRAAAGRVGHDEGDGMIGIGLGRQRGAGKGNEGARASFAGILLHYLSRAALIKDGRNLMSPSSKARTPPSALSTFLNRS